MLSGKSILTTSRTLATVKTAGEINKANLKLAALGNSTSEEFVKKVLPEATLVTVDDYTTAVNKILNDEVSALVADMPICIITAMRHPNKDLATLTQPLTVEPIGIAIPPGDAQLKSLLDSYLAAFRTAPGLPPCPRLSLTLPGRRLVPSWLADRSALPAFSTAFLVSVGTP
jgi:polar amino acid transport system substrate-binding protein